MNRRVLSSHAGMMTALSSRPVETGEMRHLIVDQDPRRHRVGCHLPEEEARVGWASRLAGADSHNQVLLVLVACLYGEAVVACLVQVQLVAAICQSTPWLVVFCQQWPQ